MAFFDQLRQGFRRFLSRIDALEERARAVDPQRSARNLQQVGVGLVEVSGGVEDLIELELDQPIDDLELEELVLEVEEPHLELDDDRPRIKALLGPTAGRWELSREDTEEVTEFAVRADSLSRLKELAEWEDSVSTDQTDQFKPPFGTEVTQITRRQELSPVVPPTERDLMESMRTEAGAIWTAAELTIDLDEDCSDESSEDFGLGRFSWNDPDMERGEEEPARFPNSLNLPDEQVLEQLRLAHYPRLVQASDKGLYMLSKVDQRLLHEVRELGRSVGGLLLCRDTVWEAACMWSCLQLDPTLRSLCDSSDLEEGETQRRIAWAAWPYLPDLLEAVGEEDPFGIQVSMDATRALLEERREVVEGDPALEQATERLPVEDCGLFAMEGFEWSA